MERLMTAWEAAKLADTLTAAQAACCIFGVPPTRLGHNTSVDPYLEHRPDAEYSSDDNAVFSCIVSALKNAITAKTLSPICITFTQSGGADLWGTLIVVEDLKDWLVSRNCRPQFFFPEVDEPTGMPDYLNPKHPRYSAKMAAAVSAWEAVTDPGGKHPKQALEKWLRENAGHFGLTNEHGNPVKQAMEECAAVANWMPGGGAPKTPSGSNLPPTKA